MKILTSIFVAMILFAMPLSAKSKRIYVTEEDLMSLNERMYYVKGEKAYRVKVLHCSDIVGYYFYRKDIKQVKVKREYRVKSSNQ